MTASADDEVFNRGCQLQAQGRAEEAIACFRQAIAAQPGHAHAWCNLAGALINSGKLAEAMACCERALALQPDMALAHYNLGRLLLAQGRWQEAVTRFERALQTLRQGVVYNDLGVALQNTGRIDEAMAAYREAIRLEPGYAAAHFNLGNMLHDKAVWQEAVSCYTEAIRLAPQFVDAYCRLGGLLFQKHQVTGAIECLQAALRINPRHADARLSLGLCQFARGQLDEAIASYREALAVRPDLAHGWNNLGMALTQAGEHEEANACYRRALELRPGDATIHSNMIFGMLYAPDPTGQRMIEECRRWEERHAAPPPSPTSPPGGARRKVYGNSRDPERRLRIGYVSPDFRNHPAARCLLPLFENHDRSAVEIFCYYNYPTADAVTAALRLQAAQWRDVIGLGDQQVAQMIMQDQIDVLVDLAVHSNHHRLGVFARKPAPVQVTWLAYPGTTGLSAIDYRLSDPQLDPAGADETKFAERTMRLPETFWCCAAGPEHVPVGGLPALRERGGGVTFGSFNNFSKVSAKALETWAEILRQVPGSRLALHAHPGRHRERIEATLEERGVERGRCTFAGRVAVLDYFAAHQRIDLGLDSFPFGGGLTTFDALWMGVPVVSLAGHAPWHRSGASILANAGLRDLAAGSCEEYVRIAVELAGDLPRLAALRAGLRERLKRSPLMDGRRFARNMEAAYRTMWREWCARPTA